MSIIFGVKRFHQYIFGRRFILLTDHKPLTNIFGPKVGVPTLAAARMQRWALLLSAYSFKIEYRNTKEHANADGLSRWPLPVSTSKVYADISTKFNIMQMSSLPLSHVQLRAATRTDPVLGKVLLKGWTGSHAMQESCKQYWRRREELTVEADCILLGTRVVVPTKLRDYKSYTKVIREWPE